MGLSGLHDIRNTNCVSFVVASEWTSVSYFGEKKKEKRKNNNEETTTVRQLHVRTVNHPAFSANWQQNRQSSVTAFSRFANEWAWQVSLGGAATSISFVATNVFFSRQARDKTHPSQAVTSVSVIGGSCHKYHLCVHQPNDANRYDYHLVYTSFPLAFSYISINSHRHWGCSSVHVLWHVINSLIIKISM